VPITGIERQDENQKREPRNHESFVEKKKEKLSINEEKKG